MDTDAIKTTLMNSNLVGIFCTLNNKIAILPEGAEKREIKLFKDAGLDVIQIGGQFDALANLIVMNDNCVVCSPAIYPELKRHIKCEPLKVAGSDLTGSALFVTNAGFLAHRDASHAEVENLERLFKSKGNIGTVNFGDPFVRSGLVGNKKGIIAGLRTSGPEMARIDNTFLLIEG